MPGSYIQRHIAALAADVSFSYYMVRFDSATKIPEWRLWTVRQQVSQGRRKKSGRNKVS